MLWLGAFSYLFCKTCLGFLGKKIGQVGCNLLLNIAHKIIWWFCKCAISSSKRKMTGMSLFSNEQRHRKIKKKKQGSCLYLARKPFFAITEGRDKGYCVCACVLSCVRLFATLWATVSSVHGIFPGKNTGMGCHFLLLAVRNSSQGLRKAIFLGLLFCGLHNPLLLRHEKTWVLHVWIFTSRIRLTLIEIILYYSFCSG